MRVISLKNYCDNTRVVIQLLQYQNKVCFASMQAPSIFSALSSMLLAMISSFQYVLILIFIPLT